MAALAEAKGFFSITGALMSRNCEDYPMKYTDIAIIGGGLTGSTAAAMLGRASIAVILVDPHR